MWCHAAHTNLMANTRSWWDRAQLHAIGADNDEGTTRPLNKRLHNCRQGLNVRIEKLCIFAYWVVDNWLNRINTWVRDLGQRGFTYEKPHEPVSCTRMIVQISTEKLLNPNEIWLHQGLVAHQRNFIHHDCVETMKRGVVSVVAHDRVQCFDGNHRKWRQTVIICVQHLARCTKY